MAGIQMSEPRQWRHAPQRQPSSDEYEATTDNDEATPDNDEATTDNDEAEEIKWQRNILLRARKAIGDAKLQDDRWALPDPPEPGLIKVVQEAAEAWTKVAKYLKSIADAGLEEAREILAQELKKAS
jgi:hypothetical protein